MFEELAQDIGVAAEAHVDAGLHHLDQVVEAGGRVRAGIDEVIGRNVDQVVFDLGGDVAQEGDFQPRPSDRADQASLIGRSGSTWYRS